MINTINTRIDTARALPIALNYRHGETVLISIALYNQGQPLKLSEEVTATLFYRTNDLADNQWYKSDDSVGIDNEGNYTIVNLLWTGKLDNGADFYQYAIQLTDDTNHSYAIHGSIALEYSPGFVPNEIALPVKLLDFQAIEVKNAPYYTKAEIDTELEAIDKSLADHAQSIEDLREEITGDAEESLKEHEENHNNPHQVKASQLTEKSSSAGTVLGAWHASTNGYYFDGYVNYYFDSGMYNEGQGAFRITIPNGLSLNGVDIGGQLVEGVTDWEIVTDYGNWSGYVYRTKTTINVNGLDLYVFASLNLESIIAKENITTPIWVGVGLTKDPNDYANTLEVATAEFDSSSYAPINTTMYKQSGNYSLLTERCLRDTATGVAYALSVTNGELHLTPYKETKFED